MVHENASFDPLMKDDVYDLFLKISHGGGRKASRQSKRRCKCSHRTNEAGSLCVGKISNAQRRNRC